MKTTIRFLILEIFILIFLFQTNSTNSLEVNEIPKKIICSNRNPISINFSEMYMIDENNLSGRIEWGDGTHDDINISEASNNHSTFSHNYFYHPGKYPLKIIIYKNQNEIIREDEIEVIYYYYPPHIKPSNDAWYLFIHFLLIAILFVMAQTMNLLENKHHS